jgi:DnaJ-class molecular chaperone
MTTEELDYYAILEVEKNATQEQIKKAFRKLAILHHPDKTGGDSTKIKLINEAYAILSDDDKRQIYDQFGSQGLKEYESSAFTHQPLKLSPLVVPIECDLSELYKGTKKQVTVKRFVIEGNIKKQESLIKNEEEEVFEIEIEPMTTYSESIIHREKGHRHKTENLYGDLIFKIVSKQDENTSNLSQFNSRSANTEYKGFTLIDCDLHYTFKLSLSEALIGFRLKIEFLDGRELIFSSSEITQPNTIKVVPDLGFSKNIRTPMGIIPKKGQLYLHFEVKFPDSLTANQSKHIVTAFGMPRVDKQKNISDDQSNQSEQYLKYKVDQLKTYDPDNQEQVAQQIFFGPGMMSGMGAQEGPECRTM